MSNTVSTVDRITYRLHNLPRGAKYCPPPCQSYSGSGEQADPNSKTQKRKRRRAAAIAAGTWDAKKTPAPC